MAKQLANLDSDITTKGRDLSKRIERALKKEVFYPIAELVSGASNQYIRSNHTKCPSCNHDWSLETTFGKVFNFKCDKCLLLGYELTTYGVK